MEHQEELLAAVKELCKSLDRYLDKFSDSDDVIWGGPLVMLQLQNESVKACLRDMEPRSPVEDILTDPTTFLTFGDPSKVGYKLDYPEDATITRDPDLSPAANALVEQLSTPSVPQQLHAIIDFALKAQEAKERLPTSISEMAKRAGYPVGGPDQDDI